MAPMHLMIFFCFYFGPPGKRISDDLLQTQTLLKLAKYWEKSWIQLEKNHANAFITRWLIEAKTNNKQNRYVSHESLVLFFLPR